METDEESGVQRDGDREEGAREGEIQKQREPGAGGGVFIGSERWGNTDAVGESDGEQ